MFWQVIFWLLAGSVGLARSFGAGETAAAPQPVKAAVMIVIAHPDDEAYFPGLLPYLCLVRKLPVVFVVMTSGEAGITPPGNRELREEEMRRACRIYGMPNEPGFARFADGAYLGTLEDNWKLWGGEDKAAAWLVQQIRRYRPEVIVTHALDGEYGHPNHVGTALSVTKAFAGASDPVAYPLAPAEVRNTNMSGGLAPWAPKKLYVHRWATRPLEFRQDVPLPGGNGQTCLQLGNLGGRQHVSQGYGDKDIAELDGPALTKFGLYATTVGPDEKGGDLLEHIDPAALRTSSSARLNQNGRAILEGKGRD